VSKVNPNDQIDLALFKIAFPSTSTAKLIPWIEPIRKACREFGVDTVREIASFLANIAVESKDLQLLEESLNYSVAGLRETFGAHRISNTQCAAYGRLGNRRADQRAIANTVYGGAWGKKNLGNLLPNDGWDMRGQGLKQITGRDNHEKCAKALKKPIAQLSAYLKTYEGAARSAGWFWQSHGLDKFAATPGVTDDRKAINGGANGLKLVEIRFDLLIKELLKRGC
jgi:putative chitinase